MHEKEYFADMPNMEQLKSLAEEMAAEHQTVVSGRKVRPKLPKLEENKQALIQAYQSTNEEIKSKGNIIPAAEWLLDNYYIIEEQYKEILYNIKKDFCLNLPILSKGKHKGYARVYGIAAGLVELLDGKIDEDAIVAFLEGYQNHSPLFSRELWTLPTMLRVCLLECIKDIAVYISDTMSMRKQADYWAEKLLKSLEKSREDSSNSEEFRKAIIEHDNQIRSLKPAYVERLLSRLRDEDADTAPIIRWVDGKLAVLHTDADEIVHQAHQEQAYNQSAIGNAVTSLRTINGLKWEELFEDLSVLERILRQDPGGVYSLMDFATRDHYRHTVERLALKHDKDEFQVAVKALECARENDDKSMEKFSHVGYYIVDRGRALLEKKLAGKSIPSSGVHWNAALYFGSIGLLTFGGWFAFLAGIRHTSENTAAWSMIPAAVLSFLPILSIAISLVHWVVTRICKPHHIPKLELKDGIPEKYRTMVVIPTLLTDEKRVIELVEQMEVFYLANQEDNIHFALIGDYKDGPEEHTDKDQKIIDTGRRLIEELNQRYGRKDIFFFFHRHRQWNASQSSWMGWERKRGALTEFNELLTGSRKTSYSIQIGELSILNKIKYVITLDADTQLPRDNAKKLIGAMAHPLNKPVLNAEGTRVVDGYGLLQPRIGVSVDSASRSFFSLTFSGQTGVDPYTTAVSDVYQDLFREGIFTGKGIYDVEIFNKVLNDAIPENAVLSHDLLEGSYVRAGLASDIELIDGYPAHYISYSLRLHRWVRGDWQLLPWLFPRVRNYKGEKIENSINALARWKIMDNMRRSLLSPALYLVIVLSFIVLPGSISLWLGLTFFTLLLPLVTDLVGKLVSGSSNLSGVPVRSVFEGTRKLATQIALTFVFVAHQAFLMTDAVIRSVWRVTVSHKNMLEWVTAADSDRRFRGELSDYWHKMKESVLLSVVFCLVAAIMRPQTWYLNIIITTAWAVSPYIAYKTGKPKEKRTLMLSDGQILKIRQIARKTWKYFEELVNEKENWLPPDNYQQEPPTGIAHRTSPTNIGLHLMSVLSARDLGYISTLSTVEKIEHTVRTMKKLDKWNGHFYNWYNTETLEPMKPLYVSTVDNGNLVGYLITLLQSLDELLKRPLIEKENILGLRDILLENFGNENLEHQSMLNMLLGSEEVNITEWQMLLDDLEGQDEKLDHIISEYEREISLFIPWVEQLQKIPTTLLNEKGVYKSASRKLAELLNKLNDSLSIQHLYDYYLEILRSLSETMSSLTRDANRSPGFFEARSWLKQLEISLGKSYSAVKDFIIRCHRLQDDINLLINAMDFKLLYDDKKELFAIGMNVEEDKLSKAYYDLLASEARQASFIAIAKGDIPQKHWFKLGRALSLIGDRRVLTSWSGTMFEYLMPLLIMKNYDNTLLDETYAAVVLAQKQHGEQHRLPWGNSESGFYAFDLHLNYQYKAFGVPKLGLKRGLVNDFVVAPYATVLALPIQPLTAYKNMVALEAEGLIGSYGFFEAVDYTAERLPKKKKSMIVKSFMAHHQGMILTAINNYLNNNIMQTRFHSVPMIKATELLLQERIPRREIVIKEHDSIVYHRDLEEGRQHQEVQAKRTFTSPDSIIPETNLLSNGSYSVMLTSKGGGYSKYMEQAVTRWREDPIRDDWGMMFYIANLNSNNYWSAAYQPVCTKPKDYRVIFQPDQVVYSRKDGNIETRMEVVVSPEFNGEVRSISLTNHSGSGRMMEVTSYFEVVLYPHTSELDHPAFTNLFVRTEYLSERNIILVNRRPRDNKQKRLWLFHTLTTDGEAVGNIQYETDRAKFIGRHRSLKNPQVMDPEFPLSNTAGAVLDPIVSMRIRVFIPAGETVQVSYITGVADSRESAISLAREHQGSNMPYRAQELAWTHSQVELRYLNITAGQASLFQVMASQILFVRPPEEWKREIIKVNSKGQTALWAYGVSGDLPIVVLRIGNMGHMETVKQMLTAHEYFRLKCLWMDLILLNEFGSSYEQPVQERLQELVAVSHARDLSGKPGGVYILQSTNIAQDDLNLIFAAARLVLNAEKGCIADQLNVEYKPYKALSLETRKIEYHIDGEQAVIPPNDLVYQNNLGGFSQDGKEYIIYLKKGESTPLPWSNIIANRDFGFLVTESGSGYTWYKNSRENKLTPWSNDPIRDPAGEAIYIRDDMTGEYWTTTALPVRTNAAYLIRHGQGYSVFESFYYGIKSTQTMFVPVQAPIKIVRVSLENKTDQPRNLSLFFYVEWVLGVNRGENARFIITDYIAENSCMLAYNRYNEEFACRTAFLSCNLPIHSYTSLRSEFLGINGSMDFPQAMKTKCLSNRAGVWHDPCSAIQIQLNLDPGESKELIFLLGQEESPERVRQLINTYNSTERAELALKEVKKFWDDRLGVLKVSTPDTSMDLMLNRWLIYQTYSARLMARTGFYQAGGAYGFRDQLQDVLALVYCEPKLMREQILLSAEHQFLEGDVQHWWHPPFRGVRTRITDDLLFLPFVTADYIEKTADWGILDELVAFLEDEPLQPDEHDRYSIPQVSEVKTSIYDHCIRAIERAMRLGSHGLPLMGGGDWNDGMDKVGIKGKGESVWLGWFLYTVLNSFIPICKARDDMERASRYQGAAAELLISIEKHAWDGGWYRRAFFDDGTPLGSEDNEECRIDSISQSWAAISGGGRTERVEAAMRAVKHYLIDEEAGLIKLLSPPFDHSALEPGYIKGYVPGVRENGGQYTHAAIWAVMAYTRLGDGNQAYSLFQLINPINHAKSHLDVSTYKVEPYVMAADVYAIPPHTGRGGWTWYTGSASWMYRVGMSEILGFNKKGSNLIINPCIPDDWPGFEITYRYGDSKYRIEVKNPQKVQQGVKSIILDGRQLDASFIPLTDDGKPHHIVVTMGTEH
jgi:cyclic beta-1,2-glucan synthetase